MALDGAVGALAAGNPPSWLAQVPASILDRARENFGMDQFANLSDDRVLRPGSADGPRHSRTWERSDGQAVRAPRKFLQSTEPQADYRRNGETILIMIELLKDLWGFMRERKKLWLAPLVVVLLVVGALLLLAEFSAVAPFIYTLF